MTTNHRAQVKALVLLRGGHMHRRELLIRLGGAIVAVPVILEAVGCDDDSGDGNGGPDSFSVTSSVDAGHSHRLTVECADLTGNGVEYVSSTDAGHTHRVTLSLGDLQAIAAGGTVNATMEASAGHTHSVAIRKPAGVC